MLITYFYFFLFLLFVVSRCLLWWVLRQIWWPFRHQYLNLHRRRSYFALFLKLDLGFDILVYLMEFYQMDRVVHLLKFIHWFCNPKWCPIHNPLVTAIQYRLLLVQRNTICIELSLNSITTRWTYLRTCSMVWSSIRQIHQTSKPRRFWTITRTSIMGLGT